MKTKPIVSVLKTTPETIIEDYHKLMHIAEYQKALPKNKETIIKLNLSWSKYYPACSTEPWQLDGVLNTLKKDRYAGLHAVENKTVVTNPLKGARENKWSPVLEKYGLKFEPLTEVEWVDYKPKHEMLALDKIFPEGHKIPAMFVGKNVVHLPTIKCVHPDTLISTSKGILKIKDIFGNIKRNVKEEKKHFNGKILTFVGNARKKTKFVNADIWKNKSEGCIYTVRLKTGKEIIVSAKHPFLTQIGWIEAQNLNKKFHNIATLRKLATLRPRNIKLNIKRIRIKKAHNSIKFPDMSSTEFCRWLAYIISEGSIENRANENYAIHFTNYSNELLTDFIKISRKLFGISFKKKKIRQQEVFFHSKQLVDLLKQIGGLNDNKKSIPTFICACTDREIVEFLSTYIDCDGTIDKSLPQISITTTNKQDAQIMQLLFQRIGIVSFLKRRIQKNSRYKDVFNITIYGDEIKKFNNFSPNFRKIENKIKFQTALKVIGERKNRFLTNYDFVPITKNALYDLADKLNKRSNPFEKRERGNRIWQSVMYYNKRIPRKSFRYLINALRYKLISLNKYKKTDFKYLDFLQNDAIIWENIIDISKSKQKIDLYDITVLENTHNFIGNGIILHNTHGHTTMTGAMKNAFGGLITEKRHHCHKMIHEVLVDLLQIQQEIHPGIFAVMDGTVCGDGAGPRTMTPKIHNYILASADQVAIDAVSAKMMGYEPMQIKFIKTAHERGLGCGDVKQIDIVGEDISQVNFNFTTNKSPIIAGDQLFRKGALSFIEPLLFHTPLFKMCIFASEFYHDYLWYNTIGKKHINKFMQTEWGELFKKY